MRRIIFLLAAVVAMAGVPGTSLAGSSAGSLTPRQACKQAWELQQRSEKRSQKSPGDPLTTGLLPVEPMSGFGGLSEKVLTLRQSAARKGANAEVWRDALKQLGFVKGLYGGWGARTHTLSFEAFEVGSHKGALALQDWTNQMSCGAARDVFTVRGAPGSIGYKLKWATGDITEQLSFVIGNTRYLVISCHRTNRAPDHRNIITASRRIYDAVK